MLKKYFILFTLFVSLFLYGCGKPETNTNIFQPVNDLNSNQKVDDFSENLKTEIAANDFISKLNNINSEPVKIKIEKTENKTEIKQNQIEKINSFFSKDNEYVYFTTPYSEFNIIE
jgi:uncharacterized protein YbcI